MSAACSAVATGPAFLGSLLRSLDCSAIQVAERSFSFLGADGGPGAALLLAAVTLVVAVAGFRLMFGPRLDLGDGAMLAVKIGAALALVTAWPVVSTVIAAPVINGPAELSGWAGTDLEGRLVHIDGGIVAATTWGTGRNDIRSPRTADGEFSANAAAGVPVADTLAYSAARLSFLLTSIAGLGFLRLAAGVLIGLAPLFAGLLLFERTRGVFAGWARTLFALLLAGTAARIILTLEAGLLEPWLAELIRQRQSFLAAPSAALELLAMTLAFGLITAALITLIIRLCLSLELPTLRLSTVAAGVAERKEPTHHDVHSRTMQTVRELTATDRAMRTANGIERVDTARAAARTINDVRAGGMAPASGFSPGSHRSAGGSRAHRPTLIARQRDGKA